MSNLHDRIARLVSGLEPTRHAGEIAALQRCRTLPELEALAREGWLTPERPGPRLRLVRHGSGTLLVVEYTDGWTRTLSQA